MGTKECEGLTGRMAPHVTRLAGKRWGALTEADKEPFAAEAAEKKAAYAIAMEAWKESDDCKEYLEACKKAKATKKPKAKKTPRRKKKAPKKTKVKKKRGRPKKKVDEDRDEWIPTR